MEDGPNHSIANSSLVPTSLYLHSNSTQILALKKKGFSEKKNFPPQKIFFLPFFYATFQCGRYNVFKKFFFFFFLQKFEKTSLKICSLSAQTFF